MSSFSEMIANTVDGAEKKALYNLIRDILSNFGYTFNNKIHHDECCFTNSVDIAEGLTLCLSIDDNDRIFEFMLFKGYNKPDDRFVTYREIIVGHLEHRFPSYKIDEYHNIEELTELVRNIIKECGVEVQEPEDLSSSSILEETDNEAKEPGWFYTIATSPLTVPVNTVSGLYNWIFGQ